MSNRLEKLFERYSAFIIKQPVAVVVIATLVTTLAAFSASRFELKTDFAELLPQDEPSVQDLNRARNRKGGLSNLQLVITGDDIQVNRKFVDDLADKFSKLEGPYIEYMKYNINSEKEFYTKNKHLYADLEDLEEIYKRLRKKIQYERIKNNPVLNLDFNDEQPEPVEFDVTDIRKKYEKKTSSYQNYIDGYFTGEDGHLYTMLLYPPDASTGVDNSRKMVTAIKKAVIEVCGGRSPDESDDKKIDAVLSAACKTKYHPSIEFGLAGGVITAIVEQEAIVDDLVEVTLICLALEGLIIILFFRVWRSIPIVVIPPLLGTTWTFGISIYIVEYLNTSTAFLAAIIVGNGINFGIIQFARYIEERRAGVEPIQALTTALKFTAQATSTAAIAAGIAYGSLIITRFRGFNGFGYMGGLGMILCWISAFTVQPAFLILLERLSPLRFKRKESRVAEGLFARPYARFVERYASSLHLLAWVFTGLCVITSLNFLRDPFEYDFRKLRNKNQGEACYKLGDRVEKLFTTRLDPMFILADRQDQVPLIMTELDRNNSVGPYQYMFEDIKSIGSFLPKDQMKKISILKKLRKLLSKSTLSWLSDDQRKEVEEYMPPEDLKPLTPKDLPYALTRIFAEKDGQVGLPIALYPNQRGSIWDGKNLIGFSEASREVILPDGERVTSAGVATIFSDMIRAIERDGPRAVMASLIGVILLVIVVYRSMKYISLVLVVLFFGVTWTVGMVALLDLKLNFLNFIGLPITFGIGIDYAVNVMNRYRIEGPGSIRRVITTTGGAVVLCSLTTIIGYSSLLIADNQALVSFGFLANLGEVTTLGAALLFMPAMVLILERRKGRIESQQLRKVPVVSVPLQNPKQP